MDSVFEMTKEDLEAIIELRDEAIDKEEDMFMYKNTPFLVTYATYLIEYLRPKFYRRANSKNLSLPQKPQD